MSHVLDMVASLRFLSVFGQVFVAVEIPTRAVRWGFPPVTFLIKPDEGLQATGHGMTECPCR